MKTILIIIGSIILAGAIAAGSFYGGMTYQSNQENQIRASFMEARGMTDQGQNSFNPPAGAGQFQRGGAGFPGGGAMGQVKTVDGNVLTLSTAQDVTTVNLSDSTQIEKTVAGATSDLQPGIRVMVTGEKEDNGDITANRISILSDNFPGTSETRFSSPPPEVTTEP
jgi:hypothetical protein